MSGEIASATFASVFKRDRTPLMFHVVIFNCFSSTTCVYVSVDPLRIRYYASSFLIIMRGISWPIPMRPCSVGAYYA